ncbi:MAG TPA: ABC transporter substrate-binding protein [Conexibacter sp.]|nr:ABC transporter substrate-binding protein [Conexibacter sp.]
MKRGKARPVGMRTLWRALAAALLLCALGLTVAACGSDSGSAGSSTVDVTSPEADSSTHAEKMSIAINPWIGYGPWYIAKAKGFDKQNGVDLDFVNFVENKDLYAAVASGRIDSTNALVSTAMTFQQAHIPLKVGLFEDISTDADAMVAAPGIDSVAQLKGKRVGFEEGGGHEMIVRLALKRAGLTLDDVQKVPLTPDKAGTALLAGRVDAAMTYEPYVSQTLRAKQGSKVIATAGQYPGVISDIWAVSQKFADEHHDAVIGALKAWNEGVDYFRSNPDDALRIMARVAETSPSELGVTLRGVKFYDVAEAQAFFDSQFHGLAEEILQLAKAQGTIQGDIDLDALADSSYLAQANSK